MEHKVTVGLSDAFYYDTVQDGMLQNGAINPLFVYPKGPQHPP